MNVFVYNVCVLNNLYNSIKKNCDIKWMKYTSYTCNKYLLIQFIQLQIQLDSPINFDIFKNIFFSLIVFFIIICTFLCYVCVVHVYYIYIYIYVIKTLSSGSDCILSAIPHLRILRAAKWFHGGFFPSSQRCNWVHSWRLGVCGLIVGEGYKARPGQLTAICRIKWMSKWSARGPTRLIIYCQVFVISADFLSLQ